MARLFTMLSVLVAMPAAAADAVEPAMSVTNPNWLSLAGNLLLVVAFVIALGWLLRRSTMSSASRTSAIRVLAAHSLGARDRLLVVEIADQQLVIGQTSQGLNTLHVPAKPLVLADSGIDPRPFAERLRKLLEGGRK